jgi:hypothetical protein
MRVAQSLRGGVLLLFLACIPAGCIGVAIIAATGTASANVFSPGGVGAGNINNIYPFDIGDIGLSSQRYQQVYGSSDFGSSPITITGLAFTPATGFTAPFSSVLPNVDISLSTTAAPVDGLSSTFAANVGADSTLVFGGPLPLSSAGIPGVFDMVIPFTTPFTYDPERGNLLLDVENFADGTTTHFGTELASGDTVSRVVADNDVNSPTAFTVDTAGLVTEFVTVVPEPSSIAALGTAIAGLALLAVDANAA